MDTLRQSPRFLFQQICQLGLGVAIPFFVEATLRARISAAFKFQDADALIFGFRQVLRGLCDGDLLLDDNFHIRGSATCLQRLLGSHAKYSGRCFEDLIDGDEARESFRFFMAQTDNTDCTDSRDSSDAAPHCLRVPLKAPSGRIVSVDVFHVRLPRLYGAESMHHLLSITEDADARVAPEASPSASRSCDDLLANMLTAERSTAPSATSSESNVECYEELAELTLLLNASTELVDVEEVHMRFVRRTNEEGLQMGPLDAVHTSASLIRPDM